MYRFLGFFCALISLPAVKATVLYTDSTESGGVLQYGSQELGVAGGSGIFAYAAGFAFTLPTGTYDDIGFDAPLEQFSSGTTTMSIYSSASNLPNTALATVTITPSTSEYTLVSGSFSGLTLTGGVTYYLVIESNAADGVNWLGTSSSSLGNYYDGSGSPLTWELESNIYIGAFDITGQAEVATPEPATIGGVSIGLAALIFSRKRWARWI